MPGHTAVSAYSPPPSRPSWAYRLALVALQVALLVAVTIVGMMIAWVGYAVYLG